MASWWAPSLFIKSRAEQEGKESDRPGSFPVLLATRTRTHASSVLNARPVTEAVVRPGLPPLPFTSHRNFEVHVVDPSRSAVCSRFSLAEGGKIRVHMHGRSHAGMAIPEVFAVVNRRRRRRTTWSDCWAGATSRSCFSFAGNLTRKCSVLTQS